MSSGQAHSYSQGICMGASQDQSSGLWDSGPAGRMCLSVHMTAVCLSWSGHGIEASGFVFLLTPASWCGESDQGVNDVKVSMWLLQYWP